MSFASAARGYYMRSLRLSIGVAALVSLMVVPAIAGQRGNSGNHGPSTHGPATQTAPTHPNGPANAGPKSTGSPKAKGPASHGSSHGPVKSDTSTKHVSNGSPKKTGTTSTSTATGSTPVTTGPTTIDFAATTVGQKLTKNVALQSKLATKLTALGYTGTVFEGAYGFKNLGQFVAATNVSQNLGIPFEQLKLQMTGLTVDAQGNVMKANLNPDGTISLVSPANATNPAGTKSLGQSIQTLKPEADATSAAKTATVAADQEIEHESSPTTSTTQTTTTKTKGDKKKS